MDILLDFIILDEETLTSVLFGLPIFIVMTLFLIAMQNKGAGLKARSFYLPGFAFTKPKKATASEKKNLDQYILLLAAFIVPALVILFINFIYHLFY